MENKKHLPLRITNAILLAASLALCVFAMINNPTDTSFFGSNPLTTVCDVLNIFMLTLGLVYLLMNYSKSAAIIYKAYFVALYIAAFLQILLISSINGSTLFITLYLISLSAIVVLATASDLGRNKSLLLAVLPILCRLVILIRFFMNISNYGTTLIGVLSSNVSYFVISLVTAYMVLGKYTDKKDRGTN